MMKKLAKCLSLIIIFLIFAANYYDLPFDITKTVFEAIETTNIQDIIFRRLARHDCTLRTVTPPSQHRKQHAHIHRHDSYVPPYVAYSHALPRFRPPSE